jgi:AcrR family transcriptional regulator
MDDQAKRKDLRIKKTREALAAAIFALLEQKNFTKITISDLCGEALISRATFYTHFKDKYDLLNDCLTRIKKNIIQPLAASAPEELETAIEKLIRDHQTVLTHLLKDADREVLGLFVAFLAPPIPAADLRHVVLADFCAGGLLYLLLWQTENKFPGQRKTIITYLHSLIQSMLTWDKGLDASDTR